MATTSTAHNERPTRHRSAIRQVHRIAEAVALNEDFIADWCSQGQAQAV